MGCKGYLGWSLSSGVEHCLACMRSWVQSVIKRKKSLTPLRISWILQVFFLYEICVACNSFNRPSSSFCNYSLYASLVYVSVE